MGYSSINILDTIETFNEEYKYYQTRIFFAAVASLDRLFPLWFSKYNFDKIKKRKEGNSYAIFERYFSATWRRNMENLSFLFLESLTEGKLHFLYNVLSENGSKHQFPSKYRKNKMFY